jgi:hypothetical protein
MPELLEPDFIRDAKCANCQPASVIFPTAATVLEAALSYAARGWAVFPVPPGTKQSYKSAKFSNGNAWGKTTYADEINRDWARWPEANVGIPTGPESGIFVVEADTAAGHGVDGIANLAALVAQHGPLPPTRMAISPSGSQHYYFKWPDDPAVVIRNSVGHIAPGIDVRGAGGMVLAPPSVKPGVGQYRWLNDLAPAAAPSWLLFLTVRLVRPPEAAHVPQDDAQPPASSLIAAMLAVINPDIDHRSWIQIGSALYSELGDEAGFAVNGPVAAANIQALTKWLRTGTASFALKVTMRPLARFIILLTPQTLAGVTGIFLKLKWQPTKAAIVRTMPKRLKHQRRRALKQIPPPTLHRPLVTVLRPMAQSKSVLLHHSHRLSLPSRQAMPNHKLKMQLRP